MPVKNISNTRKKNTTATVILPTLNEENTIGALAKELLKKRYCVIVSDDGSTDRTKEIVKELMLKNKNIMFFDHTKVGEKGIAGSVFDAIKLAKTEKIMVMDADFQHPIEKVSDLSSMLNRFELAVCYRIKSENWDAHRRLISFLGNLTAQTILFLRNRACCKDPVSGFFGFKKSILQRIERKRIVNNGFKILLDMVKQLPRSTSIGEVPYVFINRKKGSSKFKISHICLFLRSLIS